MRNHIDVYTNKNMDTSKLLQEKCLFYNKTVKDVIYECLEREGVVAHPNDIDCENYLEKEFKQYKSIEDFAFEYSKDKLKDKINSLFKDPNNVPPFLINAIIDDYFTIGFGLHDFQDDMYSYGGIQTPKHCFIKNIENINYYLRDILDPPIYFLDNDYENLKEKLRKYLSK